MIDLRSLPRTKLPKDGTKRGVKTRRQNKYEELIRKSIQELDEKIKNAEDLVSYLVEQRKELRDRLFNPPSGITVLMGR